jgi:adenylate cyclase
MRYRTKITILLALLAIFTGAAVSGLYYFQCRNILFRQIQSQVLSIAATGAFQIDGELLNRIQRPEDESTPAYETIQKVLRRIRDTNRRKDAQVRFVYTMRPTPGGTNEWSYIVDAEENTKDKSHVGDKVEFENVSGEFLKMDQPYAEESFSHDEFGVWLSANAPVFDSQGKAVALLGVDMAAAEVIGRLQNLFWKGLGATGVGLAAALVFAAAIARWANGPLKRIRIALQRISAGSWDTRVDFENLDEFGAVAEAVNKMAVALRDREMLKSALARYVSQDVADRVLTDSALPTLRGERRQITVLIADIRNFTAMTERLPPEDLMRSLNVFFERMVEAIFAHRGTLDKFLGDGLLAVFGAPIDDDEHQKMAVFAAEAMLKSSRRLRAEMRVRYKVDWRIGIGLHTGWAIVGNIGSEQRMEYTAIGDAVNATSRIEALNKQYHTEILASEAVVEAVGDAFKFREVDSVQLRGLSKPMKLYTFDTSAD